MLIKTVKSAGFCFGVKRAVKIALASYENHKDKAIYTLGQIIHNNDVVNKLQEKGIIPIENEEKVLEIKNSVVILRSHGVKKNILEKLIENNNTIVDAICPFVKKIHNHVDMLTAENYFVVIIGDKNHPEVVAISSFANKDKSIVISDPEDADKIGKKEKIGVVVQTTQELDNFLKITETLLKNKGEIRVFNSICNATSRRQKESVETSKEVDVMIVVGGKHSANTKRLYEICKNINSFTYHIENALEIKCSWFKNKKSVGITAGASTPDYVIEEVIGTIKHCR